MPSFSGQDPTLRDELMPLLQVAARRKGKIGHAQRRWAIAVAAFATVGGLSPVLDGPNGVTEWLHVRMGSEAAEATQGGTSFRTEARELLSDAVLEDSWERAMALLTQSGADVNAMMTAGAENVLDARSRKLQIPSVLPADEC